MSECRIDDVGVRESEHQLLNRYPRQESRLALEPLTALAYFSPERLLLTSESGFGYVP